MVIRRNGLQTLSMTHLKQTHKTLQGVNTMYINFILFKVTIERWSKMSNLKITKSNDEIIVDIAYWRIYLQ